MHNLQKFIVSHDLHKMIDAYVAENPRRAALFVGVFILLLAASCFGSLILNEISTFFDTSQGRI